MTMPKELVDALAAYLIVRAPYDADARMLYNAIVIAANPPQPKPVEDDPDIV